MAGIGGICTSSSAYKPCGLLVHVHSPCSLNRLGWSCCIEDVFVCMSSAAMHCGPTQRGARVCQCSSQVPAYFTPPWAANFPCTAALWTCMSRSQFLAPMLHSDKL